MDSKKEITVIDPKEAVNADLKTSLGFEFAQRVSKMISVSTLIPDMFRNQVSNCLIVLDMANSMGVNPVTLMQNIHEVKGKPGLSSKFLIALFNKSGKFSPLEWEYSGIEGTDSYSCEVSATNLKTGKLLRGGKFTVKMGKDNRGGNDPAKWGTIPRQMLAYRTATMFIDLYIPELRFGMLTTEEIEDIDLGAARVTTPLEIPVAAITPIANIITDDDDDNVTLD